ncbi:MAG: lipoyl synthase [Candidatus Hydrogenedentota bacterium]
MKPDYLKIKLRPPNKNRKHIEMLLKKYNLRTICDYALCPNKCECYNNSELTFLILGPYCSRKCGFCRISTIDSSPDLDYSEPYNILKIAKILKLKYVVITSTTRDDLPFYGASHFAEITTLLKNNNIPVELLIPDFNGDNKCYEIIYNSKPDVISHNIETVPALYNKFRQDFSFDRSISLLKWFREKDKDVILKTSILVGIGETINDLTKVFTILYNYQINILIIGQYLQPTKNNPLVVKYYSLDEFKLLENLALRCGIPVVVSSPFARSSYKASSIKSKVVIESACGESVQI